MIFCYKVSGKAISYECLLRSIKKTKTIPKMSHRRAHFPVRKVNPYTLYIFCKELNIVIFITIVGYFYRVIIINIIGMYYHKYYVGRTAALLSALFCRKVFSELHGAFMYVYKIPGYSRPASS
jgi:hypothetical protein